MSTRLDNASGPVDDADTNVEGSNIMNDTDLMNETLRNEECFLELQRKSAVSEKALVAMRSCEIVGWFDTIEEAEAVCDAEFPDGLYSLHFVSAALPEPAVLLT
jgi:hypothetical protein